MATFIAGLIVGMIAMMTVWIVGVFNMSDDEYEDGEENANDEQE